LTKYSLLDSQAFFVIINHMFKTIWLCILAVFSFSAVALAQEDCLSCHGQEGMTGYVSPKAFKQSVHGKFSCNNCHVGFTGYPHNKKSSVNCSSCHSTGQSGAPMEQARNYQLSVHGMAQTSGNASAPKCQTCHGSHYIFPSADNRSITRRQNIPTLCSRCHPAEFQEYRASIHGREFLQNNNTSAPTCFNCHEEHLVPNTQNKQWMLDLVKTCGNCHSDQIKEYRKTYHGKVTQLGYTTVAKCADCHGSHAIQLVHDPASTLSGQNILATCRKCHPAATAGFTKFYAHPDESNREKYPLIYYTLLFMTLLLIGVFTFFFTHTFLWLYRSMKERMKKKGGA
jgi:predicted CXXCH cytochrome family protein